MLSDSNQLISIHNRYGALLPHKNKVLLGGNSGTQWKIKMKEIGFFNIISKVTGKCLTSNRYGDVIKMSPCTNSYSQQWIISNKDNIINRFNDLCLEADSEKNIFSRECRTSNGQYWKISGNSLIKLKNIY